MTQDETDFEPLGLLVDKLDNAAHALLLQNPARIHKEALGAIVKDVRDELKAYLVKRGFNPWDDSP